MTLSKHDLSPSIYFSGRSPSETMADIKLYDDSIQDSDPEPSLRHYISILVRRFWIWSSVALIVLLAVAAYSFFSQRLYTATASVKIGTYAPVLPGEGAEDIFRAKSLEQDYLNTQVEQLASLPVANAVLTDENFGAEILSYVMRDRRLASLPKFEMAENGYSHPLKILKAYLGLIHVEPVFKTSLAKVSATATDPVVAARIANAHVKAFIGYARAERQRATFDNMTFLSSQAKELEERVATAEQGMGQYSEDNSLISLDTNENLVIKQISELSRKLSDSSAQRVKMESALNEAKLGSGLKSTALDDDAIRNLRTELNSVEAEYAMMSTKFGDAYPKMGQLKARLLELRRRLKEERQSSIDALESRYKSSLATEDELKRQLEGLKTQAFEVSRKQVQLHVMNREFESLKDLHQNVLRQLKEVQLSAENPTSNIIVTELAAIPDVPSSPRRTLNMLLALCFGPVLGFLVAMVVEVMDTSVKSVDQIRSFLGLPLLGVIPKFKERVERTKTRSILGTELGRLDYYGEPGPGESGSIPENPIAIPLVTARNLRTDQFITVSDPRSAAAEAFQSVRTGLLLSTPEKPPQLVLVTSATKSEGKTTLVSNLAVTMAQSGGRTVLVDCDLRRPALSERFGISRDSVGLVDYLTGQKTLEEILVASKLSNLAVIPAGAISPNPAALIGSKRMIDLLQKLSSLYDYVLLDSPPLLPVSDALMLSRMGAGVVLVVHSRDSKRNCVKEAHRRLKQANAGVLGVVLNHTSDKGDDFYAYDSYYATESAASTTSSIAANS